MVALLVVFWVLFSRSAPSGSSVGFYLFGLILGILLISQFWINAVPIPKEVEVG